MFDQIKSFAVNKVCRGDITLTLQKWDLSLYFDLVGNSCMVQRQKEAINYPISSGKEVPKSFSVEFLMLSYRKKLYR